MKILLKKIFSLVLIALFIVNVLPEPKKAEAATFSIQTGSYVGDGTDNRAITGIGFQPDLILLKDDTSIGQEGVIMKTSSMTGEHTLALAETDFTLNSNHIQSLDSDGFTIGSDQDVNMANVEYFYIAIGGSNCSATGTFCVGSYTGNGTSQSISTVGFSPDMVAVKKYIPPPAGPQSLGVWKSTSMTGTQTNYFSATASLASGGITSLDASGFSIGNNADVNSNFGQYVYFAFKEVSGAFDVGTYTGNATDNRNITSTDDAGLTFLPDAVLVKPVNTLTGVMNIREHYGDRSLLMTDNNSAANHIQSLLSGGGFQIGTSTSVNTNLIVHHYMAFGGAGNHNTDASGTYQMAQGVYVGTGSAFSLTGLGFAPDLVIIKGDQANMYAVFRTSLMTGNRTAYMAFNNSTFLNGILSLDSDGFSLPTAVPDSQTNNSGTNYYWTAYGNAMRIDRAGGASDFMVGQYIGTGNDNQNVRGLGIAPDFVYIKGNTSAVGTLRTKDQTGDASIFLSVTTQATNTIQALNTDGFQKGTSTSVNASNVIYDYFMFKTGERFETGTYTGNGSTSDITSLSAQPDYLWLKKTTGGSARQGIFRTSEAAGDWAIPFWNVASFTNRITNLIKNGFTRGTGVEANENTFQYQYVAWNNKRYAQQAYRWFANNDSTDVGAPLSFSNSSATMTDIADPFRLRMLLRVDGGNVFQNAENFDLQFAQKVGTCDTSFFGEIYADVGPTTSIQWYNNPSPTGGSALTPNANDPSDGLRTIANQSYNESNPITTSVGSVLQGQTAQFDFSLIADPANTLTSYCFRLVRSDGNAVVDSYAVIPEIHTGDVVITPTQTLTFALSSNSIGFGTLSSSQARYANTAGTGTPFYSSPHIIRASTNATNGYVVYVKGTNLSCNTCAPGTNIDAMGPSASDPSTPSGVERFGIRSSVNTGTGSVYPPYDTPFEFAYDPTVTDNILQGSGDDIATVYNMYYVASIAPETDAGDYQATITYTITANY